MRCLFLMKNKKMKTKIKFIFSIIWIIVGAVLFSLEFFDFTDTFWSGMGVGLLVIGIIQFIKQVRYSKNEEYRNEVDIEENDERNKFISGLAHAWTSYIYITVAAIATVVLELLGYDEFAVLFSISIAIMVIIYAVAFLILNKKY